MIFKRSHIVIGYSNEAIDFAESNKLFLLGQKWQEQPETTCSWQNRMMRLCFNGQLLSIGDTNKIDIDTDNKLIFVQKTRGKSHQFSYEKLTIFETDRISGLGKDIELEKNGFVVDEFKIITKNIKKLKPEEESIAISNVFGEWRMRFRMFFEDIESGNNNITPLENRILLINKFLKIDKEFDLAFKRRCTYGMRLQKTTGDIEFK